MDRPPSPRPVPHAWSRRAVVPVVALALLVAVVAGAGCSSSGSGSAAETVPDRSLTDLGGGQATSLASYRGKPLVVNVWASWCTPCRTEMPAFESVHQAVGDRVAIVGVTDDPNREAARKAAATTGVTYPLLVDPSESLQSALGITSLPATLFVDRNGTIVERHAGALDAAALTETIGRLYGTD